MNERGSTTVAPEAETPSGAAPHVQARPELDDELNPGPGPDDELNPGPGPDDELNPGPDDELNQQIADALSGLLKYAHDLAQGIAVGFGLSASDVMALVKLEAPMTMKDLGLKIGCDPSFVTSIADTLESHGLARREPSLRDRRSKNIVLTPEGEKVRGRICDEFFARAPWCTSLDTSERRCLLGLMRKMLRFREGR